MLVTKEAFARLQNLFRKINPKLDGPREVAATSPTWGTRFEKSDLLTLPASGGKM